MSAMTPSVSRHERADPTLQLKSLPPRMVRGFLVRERLQLQRLSEAGSRVSALVAPSGYGKSSQLNQWRRETLARGGLAVWYTLDERDEPLRLVRGLTHAAQLAGGKKGFGEAFMQWLAGCTDASEAAAGWLAQVAELPVDVVLLLDDAELLPAPARAEVLDTLIRCAPPNLQLALAARPGGALLDSSAFAQAQGLRLNEAELRFRPDETLAVLSAAMGGRCHPEAALGLQELTEGWPLGIQLAVAALHRSGDLQGLVDAATTDIRRYFLDSVIERQPAEALDLLVRLSQFDPIHPTLCEAVLGRPALAAHLLRLQDETPLLPRAEGSDWMRLHPLAREVLQERMLRLPQDERQALARRAAGWYAGHGLHEQAVEQAFLAGDIEQAIALVERTSDQMAALGRGTAVLAWYERLSPQALRQHPGLWAPAAWVLSMGDRHEEALVLVHLILAQPQVSDAARFEAALIAATADAFADRVDQMAQRVAPWPTPPAQARPDHASVHQLVTAFAWFYRAEPEHARQALAPILEAPLQPPQPASPVTTFQAAYCAALSYLWEGRYALAEQQARQALARAEERLGRRHPVCCNLAAALLEATWERGGDEDHEALLAGRMAVLDRAGVPDALMSAYTTLARMAEAQGRQDQALSLLESLQAIGRARGMVRLQVQALSELVGLHARHGRLETAHTLSRALDERVHAPDTALLRDFVPWAQLQAGLAQAQVGLAQSDPAGLTQAVAAATLAEALALQLQRCGDEVRARLLRAQALHRQGSAQAQTVRSEALSLAQAHGMGRWLRTAASLGVSAAPLPVAPAADQKAATSALLTAKEHEVLLLLSRNLSNKEIALAMDIGEGTIKFHLKNLYSKLDAAGRRHAVARARQLGLVTP